MKYGLNYIAEKFVSSDTLKLYELVSEMKLHIPHHQRDYSWDEEQVNQFLTDIDNLMEQDFYEESSLAHFIGAMVFIKNEETNRYEIIDGQQRLTTTMLYFTTLKFFAVTLTDPQKQYTLFSRIHSYIFSSLAGQTNEARLKLDREQEFFEQVLNTMSMKEIDILYDNIDKPKDVTTTIYNRCKQIYKYFENKFDNNLSDREFYNILLKYIEAVQTMMVCIKIKVEHSAVAYTVFETLNARGKGLSKANLIKNTLLFYAEKQHNFEYVLKIWSTVIEELTQYESIEITDFLSNSYFARFGKLENNNLFDSIKKLLEEKVISAKEYADIINKDYLSYLKVKSLDTTADSYFTKEVINNISNLNKFIKVVRIYPLIISARNYLSKDEFSTLVISSINFAFRYKVILNKSADSLLSLVINWSSELKNGKITIEQIRDKMKIEAPDGEFKTNFESFAPGTQYQRFYLIKTIEDFLSNGQGITVLDQSYYQHLEHIMPQTPKESEWSHLFDQNSTLDESFSSYLNRVGNITVLEKDINSHIKNKKFSYKNANENNTGYKNSVLKLPPQIENYLDQNIWTYESINKRGKALSEYAVKTWEL
ncbi:MAG: DUF262 domain-containing HNH endonuclease family protein [Arcobacter sp.]|jgi:uncharacterized protein with ParB-like and HNH nuclease domain|uniref:DUF262 domain-containing protein n=1 Tax=Arcobacter sp. TaxID=1872629 RepID=UPI002A75CF92|nr:DUF262 domain-containing HNH endonuclease family protein [Arcobacter sp.]MDY3205035.1 DUF262 domain-containing HNH endonuclease family protein [Arcobacter sp.]